MKSLYPLRAAIAVRATLLILLVCSFAAASAQGLVFQNPKLISGKAGADKAVYRFSNVKSGYDALVTIKGRSSSKVSLVSIDMTSSGHPQSFQPQVTYNNGTASGLVKWYMDFEVAFVQAGTTNRTQLSEIDVTALDIDGNGDKIREFIIFTNPVNVTKEMVSYLTPNELPVIDFDAVDGDPVKCNKCNVSSPLVLCNMCNGSGGIDIITNGVTTTSSCTKCNATGKLHSTCQHAYKKSTLGTSFEYIGPTTNFTNIDTTATTVMVTGTWVNTDEVIFRLGAENTTTGSNGAADRMYSLWFKTFRYLNATYLPVSLVSWKAELNNNSAQLSWSSTMEKNASHYVVERSFDGRKFTEIGTVKAAGNSENKKDYAFTDNRLSGNEGFVYYRLRSADVDGKNRYSDIRTVRVAKNAQLVIATYPNPVVDELRISLPADFQGKKVTFEVFNLNGTLVKMQQCAAASQTETLGVSTLNHGLYIVKASSGSLSAVQRIMKSN